MVTAIDIKKSQFHAKPPRRKERQQTQEMASQLLLASSLAAWREIYFLKSYTKKNKGSETCSLGAFALRIVLALIRRARPTRLPSHPR
jgi:hypothetical protein